MDELMQKLSGYLDAAAGVITEYAPQAVDAALFVVRFDAIWALVIGALALVGLYVCYRLLMKCFKWMKQEDEWGYSPFLMFASVPVIGLFAVAVETIFKAYYWIAAFDPMLGLVYKAAQSAGLL